MQVAATLGGWPGVPGFVSRSRTAGAPSLRFLQGRVRCCRYYGICHAQRPASHLRRASPALYHLLLLSTIAVSRSCAQPISLPCDSRTGATEIPVRGGGICRNARTFSSPRFGTGNRKPLEGDASPETARGSRAAAKAQEKQPAPTQPVWGGDPPPRAFWQARFYDFNVWTTKKRVEKLRYMHRNPVQRGLVDSPEQWRWSSYRFYALGEPGRVQVNVGWTEISFRDRVA